MTGLVRSWLYVPGHHHHRIAKAMSSGADAVVIDLEDSVPADRKDEARTTAAEALRALGDGGSRPPVWVRVNPPHTAAGEADIAMLASCTPDGVRVPRAEDARAIESVADSLDCPLQLLLETAKGLMAAPVLAAAHRHVVGLGLGEADLAADLRVASSGGLDWARGWIVAVSRSAGLPSPVQSVYTAVADLEGLRATTLEGRARGFLGRSVVHPRQIPEVHQAYRPGIAEVDWARELVQAFDSARSRGEAAALTSDGGFVDPAVISQAQLVLDLASMDNNTRTEDIPSEENT